MRFGSLNARLIAGLLRACTVICCSWIAGEVPYVDGSIVVELIRQLFCWLMLIVELDFIKFVGL